MDRERIIRELSEKLYSIAGDTIIRNSRNANFIKNPDDPKEHDPFGHHQYGIITHTQKFLEVYQGEMQTLFKEWGISSKIIKYLSLKIDDVSKDDLMQIAITLHDIGKFARNFKFVKSVLVPDYMNHEEKSEKLIMENHFVQNLLRTKFRLTSNQINYIARCASLHFELGKIRNKAKETSIGYSFAFIADEQFKRICKKVAGECGEFKVEVGILFLGDNLAKTDVVLQATSEAEIDQQISATEKNIKERGLNSQLIVAAKQRPVNIAVAKKYLKTILEMEG